MSALPLILNALHKEEIKYHGKLGHTLKRIQHIDIMSRIKFFYATFCLSTKTVAPTIPRFQGIKRCVKYLDSHPHKPLSYPYNSYDGSNVIILKCGGNQVE